MTTIKEKREQLGSRPNGKLILEKSIGPEQSAGFGGTFQQFKAGDNLCNIYAHPIVGTFEVHGAILKKYILMGGTGNHPILRKRVLGFPVSDEQRTKDGYGVVSHFEWGSIFWGYDAGAVPLYGRLHEYMKTYKGSYMGYPICEPIVLSNKSNACFFENALLIESSVGSEIIHFEYTGPLVGNPHISPVDALSISQCYTAFIPSEVWKNVSAIFPNMLVEICKNRLFLESVKTKSQTEATLNVVNAEPPNPSHPKSFKVTLGLSAKALLDKTLYNIGIRNQDFPTAAIIGLHCIYARKQWDNFGVMHATDLHVSVTNDTIYSTLNAKRKNGTSYAETANKHLVNFNDNFRDFIRYANKLHDAGEVDIIMLTGDLIDFQYETFYDAAVRPSGNFLFFQHLIQGKAKSPNPGVSSEELRVPTLLCLGNHDYRRLSYLLRFATEIRASDIVKLFEFDTLGEIIGGRTGEIISYVGKPFDVIRDAVGNAVGAIEDGFNALVDFFGGDGDSIKLSVNEQKYFGQYNLLQSEIKGIYRSDKPIVKPARALNMLIVNEPDYYFNRLNNKAKDQGSTKTYLGSNAILMVESGHDEGAPKGTDTADAANMAFDELIGTGGESRQNMLGGDPDSTGITNLHLAALTNLLNDKKVTGVVLVGIHAPVINIPGNDYPPYFRESVYQSRNISEVNAFLKSKDDSARPWLDAIGKPYFTTGDVGNRLDSGTSKGFINEFVQACAGKSVIRPVELLLSGHVHRNVEFRIKWNPATKMMEYYYDFYSENPANYYNTKLQSANNGNSTVVRLVQDTFVNETQPSEAHRNVNGKIVTYYQQVTRPNPDTLNTAKDKKAWWMAHKPLITQTAALGPLEGARRDDPDDGKDRIPQAIFQGFRVIKIRNNIVDKMHYVKLQDLRSHNYSMPWEGEYKGPLSGVQTHLRSF